MNGQTRDQNDSLILAIIGLLALIFVGVFGLAALGRDLAQVVYFIGPTIVLLGGVLVSYFRIDQTRKETEKQTDKIDAIEENVEAVAGNVNGRLDKKFEDLHKKLDNALNANSSEGL